MGRDSCSKYSTSLSSTRMLETAPLYMVSMRGSSHCEMAGNASCGDWAVKSAVVTAAVPPMDRKMQTVEIYRKTVYQRGSVGSGLNIHLTVLNLAGFARQFAGPLATFLADCFYLFLQVYDSHVELHRQLSLQSHGRQWHWPS